MAFLKVQNLGKQYSGIKVLDQVSFELPQNKITVLVGVNGAGKSTLLKSIAGILALNSGNIVFDGLEYSNRNLIHFRKKLRFLSENNSLDEEMTVEEYWDYVSLLWPSKKKWQEALSSKIEKLRIADRRKSLIKNLSKGLRQRVGLVGSFIGEPKLLILDEPFSGLDPHQMIEMRDFFISLKKETTFLISSHLLGELDKFADEVIFIHQGKIIGKKSIEQKQPPINLGVLFKNKSYYSIRYKKNNAKSINDLKKYLAEKKIIYHLDDTYLFLLVNENLDVEVILSKMKLLKCKVMKIYLKENDLETAFLNYLN